MVSFPPNASFGAVSFFVNLTGNRRQEDQAYRITLSMVFATYSDYQAMQSKVARAASARQALDGSITIDVFGGASDTLTYPQVSCTAVLTSLQGTPDVVGIYQASGDFLVAP